MSNFSQGNWVNDTHDANSFGVITHVEDNGVQVIWSTGLVSKESGESLAPASADLYLAHIKDLAREQCQMSDEAFAEHFNSLYKDPSAPMSIEFLSKLEEIVLGIATETTGGEPDTAWDAIEQAAAQDDGEDIFAGLGDDTPVVEDPRMSRITAEPDENHPGEFCIKIDGDIVEQFYKTPEEAEANRIHWVDAVEERDAQANVPDAVTPVSNMCVLCNAVKTNKNSPTLDDGRRICKKCQMSGTVVSEVVAGEVVDYFPGAEPEPAPQSVLVNHRPGDLVKCMIGKDFHLRWGIFNFKRDNNESSVSVNGVPYIVSSEEVHTTTLREFYDHVNELAIKVKGGPLSPFNGAHTYNILNELEMNYLAEQAQIARKELFGEDPKQEGNGTAAAQADAEPATETIAEDVQTVEASGTTVNESKSYYIAACSSNYIWGIGENLEACKQDADKHFEDYHKRPAENGELEFIPASRALYAATQRGDGSTKWEMVDGLAVLAVAKREPAKDEPARTDAGLIDPETGEIIEPSLILKKLGWTELPSLGPNPTPAEINEFEARLDDVVDRACSHRERAARYRAACEARCKPLDSAAEFWFEQFIRPMAKMLAPHRLKKNKKGGYSTKTLTLQSGLVKFSKKGGAYVHDAKLLKEFINRDGVEKYKAIEAERAIVYSHNKLIAALNKGTLKNLPGTGIKPPDELAEVKLALPGATESQQEENDE